jgi:hypothetical protein
MRWIKSSSDSIFQIPENHGSSKTNLLIIQHAIQEYGTKKHSDQRYVQNRSKVCIRRSSNCSYWNLAIDIAGYCWIDFNMQQHSTSRTDILIVFATSWPNFNFRVENSNWGAPSLWIEPISALFRHMDKIVSWSWECTWKHHLGVKTQWMMH